MAKFKVIISDPETGKSRSIEVEGTQAVPLVGRKLGEVIEGSVVKMRGYKLKITGGSDKDGFPMRSDVHGGIKSKVLLSRGVGFKPKEKGGRRRKTIRGNMITEEITQINIKIVEKPQKSQQKKQQKTKPKQNTEDTKDLKNV